MKKLLLLVFSVILLTSCTSTPIEGTAPETAYQYAQKSNIEVLHNGMSESVTTFTYVTPDNIKYRVFMYDGYQSGALFVINETKESLEIEKLRK